jgi:hypothetical protein
MPREIPGWPAEWHEHSGLLADSAALVGKSRRFLNACLGDARLDDPGESAGALAADNWSLPFVCAGIPSLAVVDADAGRAMSLTVGGDDFLRDALTDADLRTPHNAAAVDSTIAAARSRVLSIPGTQPMSRCFKTCGLAWHRPSNERWSRRSRDRLVLSSQETSGVAPMMPRRRLSRDNDVSFVLGFARASMAQSTDNLGSHAQKFLSVEHREAPHMPRAPARQ